MTNSFSNSKSRYIQRSNAFCEQPSSQAWPRASSVLRCFNESASLSRWDECLEYKVHANVHAWMGGAWDCAVDFTALHTANTTLYPTKARARSLDARPAARGRGPSCL